MGHIFCVRNPGRCIKEEDGNGSWRGLDSGPEDVFGPIQPLGYVRGLSIEFNVHVDDACIIWALRVQLRERFEIIKSTRGVLPKMDLDGGIETHCWAKLL
jgi:hypothetical protein